MNGVAEQEEARWPTLVLLPPKDQHLKQDLRTYILEMLRNHSTSRLKCEYTILRAWS